MRGHPPLGLDAFSHGLWPGVLLYFPLHISCLLQHIPEKNLVVILVAREHTSTTWFPSMVQLLAGAAAAGRCGSSCGDPPPLCDSFCGPGHHTEALRKGKTAICSGVYYPECASPFCYSMLCGLMWGKIPHHVLCFLYHPTFRHW